MWHPLSLLRADKLPMQATSLCQFPRLLCDISETFCDQITAEIVPNNGEMEKYPSSHSRALLTEKPHSVPGSPDSTLYCLGCLLLRPRVKEWDVWLKDDSNGGSERMHLIQFHMKESDEGRSELGEELEQKEKLSDHWDYMRGCDYWVRT